MLLGSEQQGPAGELPDSSSLHSHDLSLNQEGPCCPSGDPSFHTLPSCQPHSLLLAVHPGTLHLSGKGGLSTALSVGCLFALLISPLSCELSSPDSCGSSPSVPTKEGRTRKRSNLSVQSQTCASPGSHLGTALLSRAQGPWTGGREGWILAPLGPWCHTFLREARGRHPGPPCSKQLLLPALLVWGAVDLQRLDRQEGTEEEKSGRNKARVGHTGKQVAGKAKRSWRTDLRSAILILGL